MIKKYIKTQQFFNRTLRILAFLALRNYNRLTKWATSLSASLNVFLNKPKQAKTVEDLSARWLEMMPPDGQEFFKISNVDKTTAYTEIHLHCPLRGSGDAKACYHLMNYDRKLMEKVGGQLIVLESQSNSGKPYCKLAIRKKGVDTSDLVPAHEK